MPGNVTTYTPTTVFPQIFARQFTMETDWATRENAYPDMTSQRASIPAGTPAKARRRFRASLKLAATAMSTLMTFYADRKGQQIPFFMYYPWETSPMFTHDPTGTETTGRYTVRFAGPLRIDWRPPRGVVDVELVEVT